MLDYKIMADLSFANDMQAVNNSFLVKTLYIRYLLIVDRVNGLIGPTPSVFFFNDLCICLECVQFIDIDNGDNCLSFSGGIKHHCGPIWIIDKIKKIKK